MKNLYLVAALICISNLSIAQLPVAHYPFNGNANDAVGALNGTNGGAVLSTDRFGNASNSFRFDGADDHVDLSNSNIIRPTSALTISAWFNLENAAGAVAGRQILSCTENSGYQIAYDKALNAFVLYVRRNGNYGFVQTPAAPYLTGWHFITGSFDGRFTRLYMDGIQVAFDDAGATFPIQYFSGVKTYIGAETSDPVATGVSIDPNFYWQGRIDEVKIYNTALTAPQILLEFTTNAGPVAHYPFNSNANDAIGTNHGTTNGGTTLTADRFGKANSAYNFDGIDDFISTANLATNQTDNWTMTAWVKPSSIAQNNGTIVLNGFDNGGTGNGFSMVMGDATNAATGNLFKGFLNGLVIVNSGLTFNTNNIWYYTVLVREAGVTKLYLDGVLSGTTITSTPNTPSGSLRIGSSNGIRFWNGAIDEVKVYNTALTATQVRQEYASSSQLQKPGSGNALSFNGNTDSVNIVNSPTINFGTGEFSIDFWYNSLVSREELIIDKRDDNCADGQNWAIRKSAVGQVFFEVNIPGPSSDFVVIPQVTDGKWHHIAFVRTDSRLNAYKDGILVDTRVAVPQNVNNTANLKFGTGPCSPFLGGGGFFTGSLDEIRLWNTSLSESQIRERMCKKITSADALYPNLVSYYNFDENSGTIAFDGTINGNNGTLVNSPTRVISGAAIGNTSSYDYLNTIKTASLTHPTGENLTAISTSGSPDGIQIYVVDESPNNVSGASGVGANNKYFGVFQVGGTSPQYTAVYNYSGNPLINSGNEPQLRLNSRLDNSTSAWTPLITAPNEAANTITVSGTNAEYILGRLGGSLPLQIISFTAIRQSNNSMLQWKTANEINTDRFEIQRSDNAADFKSIGSVNAGGAVYSFNDIDVFAQKSIAFYRIKIIDRDGKFTYSGIVKLSKAENSTLSIFPNPASDRITIVGLKENGNILLFNAVGQLLLQQRVVGQTTSISLGQYAKGTYWLQFDLDGERQVKKIIKQ